MFARKPREVTPLDQAIEEAIRMLDPNDESYLQQVEAIERLSKLRDTSSRRVSPDTQAMVAANLGGILLILFYEQAHNITSRAFNLLLKMR